MTPSTISCPLFVTKHMPLRSEYPAKLPARSKSSVDILLCIKRLLQKRTVWKRLFAVYALRSAYSLWTIRAREDAGEQERRAMQAEVTREWVTYRQAEEIAGLSRTTLRKLVDQDEIQIRRVGRAVRINRASLDAYMNGNDF